MTATDPVPKKLRDIETQVDYYHQANPLFRLPFGEAAWYYMAFCEDVAAKPIIMQERHSMQEAAALADMFMMELKSPFYWFYSSCEGGGVPPCSFNKEYYQASIDLFNIAENYHPFEAAFTYASRALIELSIEGSTIVSTPDFLSDTRYEAYDRLFAEDVAVSEKSADAINELVAPSVKISGEMFSWSLNPKLVSQAIEFLGPMLDARYSLPGDWMFNGFYLNDFKRVANCLITIAYLHFSARLVAIKQGCVGLGYSNSLFLTGRSDLENRIARYSGCDASVVSRLIQMLTYGEMGITRPDPAIQPIIQLNAECLALMPNLFINNSIERNFAILLNKLPSEKDLYSRLVYQKEGLMRSAIEAELKIKGIRFFTGNLSEALPDVDLAIINDIEKVCLIVELKWFIAPAEVREVIEKSEEIAKGISQLLSISSTLATTPGLLLDKLQVDADYDFLFTVVSDSYIGMLNVQHPHIPVVRSTHFINQANSFDSLRQTMDWLSNREYLPSEGKHYEKIEKVWNVGEWGLRWYGLRPLH